jgi:hypothetical protein
MTLAYDTECLTEVRERPGSVSRVNRKGTHLRFIELRRDIHHHLREQRQLSRELEEEIWSVIVRQLRRVYEVSPAEALELHRVAIPEGFVPRLAREPRTYAVLYRVLGFRRAQAVWHWLRRTSLGRSRLARDP